MAHYFRSESFLRLVVADRMPGLNTTRVAIGWRAYLSKGRAVVVGPGMVVHLR